MVPVAIGSGATRQSPAYRFPKREACLMAMSYSYELQAKVFDRMTELEAASAAAGPALPNFTDPAAAAIAWAEEFKAKRALQLENAAQAQALEVAAPKAQALDRIATPTDGAVCLRVAAKLLQIPERQFMQFANAEGFIFRHHYSSIWQGYSDKVKAGMVELKLTRVEREDGTTKVVEQVLLTRKGIAKLGELYQRRHQAVQSAACIS